MTTPARLRKIAEHNDNCLWAESLDPAIDELREAADEIERLQGIVDRLHTPRRFDDWHEDIGNVLWWSFPIGEPPYSGEPYDDEFPFEYDDLSVGWVPLPDCDMIQEIWEAAEKARQSNG